jgi:ankyrin repeat protein
MSAKLPTVKVDEKTYSLLIVKTGSTPKQRYFLLDEKLGEGNDSAVYVAYEATKRGVGKFRYELNEKAAKPLAIKIEKNYSSKDRPQIMKQREVESKIPPNPNTDIYPIGDHGIAKVRLKVPGKPLNDLINTKEFKKLTLSQRLELAKTYAEFHQKQGEQGRKYNNDKMGANRINLNQSNFLVDIRYAAGDKKHEHPIFECNKIDFVDLSVRTPLTTAPECMHGEEIGCPLDNALEMETYSLTAMIALILGETDVFKDKKNNEDVKGKFNLDNMQKYLEKESKESKFEIEIKAVIDMVQSMQNDNPALRPSAPAIVKVLDRAQLAVLGKEHDESDDAKDIEKFFAAIKAGDLEYINENSNPNMLAQLDIEGLTPLGVAIKHGQNEIAKKLFEQYNSEEKKAAVRQTDSNGRTLLHLAILAKNAVLVNSLLENGAEANKKDADNRTPLHCALSMRCGLEIVKDLLDKRADVEEKDNHGRYPEEMAIANKCDVAIVKLLLERTATYKDYEKDIKLRIKLLFLAIKSGSKELVEYFLNGDIIKKQHLFLVSPLHFAASVGHVEVAEFLITKGFSPVLPDREGNTPLHYAAMKGQLEMAILLLVKGANLGHQTNAANQKFHEVTDSKGNTLLHIAIREGNVGFAKKLIASGANVNTKDGKGFTPLHLAIIKGDIRLVELLIASGANVNAKNSEGMTPLHLAASYRKLELVQLLLQKNPNLNIEDKNGQKFHEVTDSKGNTLLHIAIDEGKIDLAKMLIGIGANVNVTNSEGKTPLYLAISNRELGLIQLLLEQGADPNREYGRDKKKFHEITDSDENTLLHIAIDEGKANLAKRLIDMGANVNAQNKQGQTPLHLAAIYGELGPIQLLLRHNADTELKDGSGRKFHEVTDSKRNTLLHIAIHEGKIDLAKKLIEMGADLDAQNSHRETPLHLAAIHDGLWLVQLLERNGNPELKDDNKNTLLHIAIHKGQIDLARKLIKIGTDVNAQNSQGNTPLHLAAIRGDLKLVKLLLENDADPAIANDAGKKFHQLQQANGDTVLHLAARRGDLKFVQLLLEKGADPTIANNDRRKFHELKQANGGTALSLAMSKHIDDVKLISTLMRNGAKLDVKDGKQSAERKELSFATRLYRFFSSSSEKEVVPAALISRRFVKLPPAA